MESFEDLYNFRQSAYEATRAAVAGCGSMLDFLRSPLHGQAVKTIIVEDGYALEALLILDHAGPLFLNILLADAAPSMAWGQDALYIMATIDGDWEPHVGSPWPFLVALRDYCTSCSTFILQLSPYAVFDSADFFYLLDFIASAKSLRTLHLGNVPNQLSRELNHLSREFNENATHQHVGEALLHNSSLQVVSIAPPLWSQLHILSLLTRRSENRSSITCLCIHLNNNVILQHNIDLQEIILLLTENTISLTTLQIVNSWRSLFRNHPGLNFIDKLAEMLLANTSLTSLGLYNFDLTREQFHALFTSLEQNTSLISLGLRGCSGGGWSSNLVLDCLQVNYSLRKLDLTDTPLEDCAPRINSQLKRNLQNAQWMKEFELKVRPTAIRLFLCGLPFSGKTALSRSLAKSVARSVSSNNTCCKPSVPMYFTHLIKTLIERAHGIDVAGIVDMYGIKVSLWDLAGHRQYHAIYEQMFPNLSNRASPALFLFVWNPFEVDAKTGRCRKNESGEFMKKAPRTFEMEFKYWLKFLVSKTLRSRKYRPQLLVAVTRADYNVIRKHTPSLIKQSFASLREEFKDLIDFDMDAGFFVIDARDPAWVEGLALHVLKCAEETLKMAPHVYQRCEEARTKFSGLVQGKKIAPLVSKETFRNLCEEHLQVTSRNTQEAIALVLNDSGDIIYFTTVELVVMDVQWFRHHVMGDLLDQCMASASSDGLVSEGFFVQVDALEEIANSATSHVGCSIWRPSKAPLSLQDWRVRGGDMVQLLIRLQLACAINTQQIFIPLVFSSSNVGDRNPRHSFVAKNNTTYLGRRLRCQDSSHTFFTPNLLSLLQVAFHSDLKRIDVEVRLEENFIAFAYEGVEVFIVTCKEGEEQFIDILISSPKDLDGSIEWMRKYVTKKMEKICAEPRGIQGVDLAYEVIRPKCVAQGPCLGERRQAVSIERLKVTLEKHLEEKGYQLEGEDALDIALYTWQLTKDSDCIVRDLVGQREVQKVVESYFRSLGAAAEDALGLNLEERKQVARKDLGVVIEATGTIFEEGEASDTSFEEGDQASGTSFEQGASCSSKPQFSSTWSGKVVGELQKIGDKMDMHYTEIMKELQKMGDRMEKHFKGLHIGIQNLRNVVQKGLGELLSFAEEGEKGKLPRMYCVTIDNERKLRKIAPAMVHGLTNMWLELLCECRSGPHFVEVEGHQYGISFTTLDNGLIKDALPYVKAFLKVAYLAVKVGAHVAAGMSDSIPDFTHVLALILDTNGVRPGLRPTFPGGLSPSTSTESRVNYRDGQRWLHDVLARHNCLSEARIHEVFGLNKVHYRSSKAVAWVCDKHHTEGAS